MLINLQTCPADFDPVQLVSLNHQTKLFDLKLTLGIQYSSKMLPACAQFEHWCYHDCTNSMLLLLSVSFVWLQVSGTASDLMSHLLKSQLLMSPTLWQALLKELARSLPILQVGGCWFVFYKLPQQVEYNHFTH